MTEEQVAKRRKAMHADYRVNLPLVLEQIILDYFGEFPRLHMWIACAEQNEDFRWMLDNIPTIDDIDFYLFFRENRAEITSTVGSPYPDAIDELLSGSYSRLYVSFGKLDDKVSPFYSDVAYSMLQSESFRPMYRFTYHQDIVGALFYGVADGTSDLLDIKKYPKPHVQLKMIQCLLSACEKRKVRLKDLNNDARIVLITLGIGVINNVSADWYHNFFDILAVPSGWWLPDIYGFREDIPQYFSKNAALVTALRSKWPQLRI